MIDFIIDFVADIAELVAELWISKLDKKQKCSKKEPDNSRQVYPERQTDASQAEQ